MRLRRSTRLSLMALAFGTCAVMVANVLVDQSLEAGERPARAAVLLALGGVLSFIVGGCALARGVVLDLLGPRRGGPAAR